MRQDRTAYIIPSDQTYGRYYFYLFIIWPFLAFLMALRNYSRKEAKIVIYLFLIYYGLTFVNNQENVDAFRYILSLQATARLPFSSFFQVLGGLYSDTTVDIAEPFVRFVVSRFTTFHGIYFAVWAAIFGYFYLKSINLLHDRYQLNHGWNTFIPMAFFVLIQPIDAINGVRMWTAAWIFFYGAYHVVLYRDKRYILLALSASFVHWSFFSANAILLIYFFAGNRNVIYLPLAVLSFASSNLLYPVYNKLSNLLGGAFLRRFEAYSSETYVLHRQIQLENSSWFIQLNDNLIFYYLLFAIIVIQFNTWRLEKEKIMQNLYSFLLLFLAFVNFGMPIPSFGMRFQIVFLLFATLYLFIYYIRIRTERIQLLILLGILPMLLNVAVTFRSAFQSLSVWLFTPGLGLPLLAPVKSVYDLLF